MALEEKGNAKTLSHYQNYVSGKEKWGFALAAGGQGMVYAIMSSYISDFYLSVMGLTPLFVLLLMLLARIWDAINDPIMGMIVDRHQFKKSKFKPYIIITPIPVAILTLLLFYSPNIGTTEKMIYATITYVLWGMIYTVSDVPFWSLPNAMTPNPKERANVISLGRTVNGVGSAIPMVIVMGLGFVLPLFGLSGNNLEQTRYIVAALIASIGGNLIFMLAYFRTKERVTIPRPVVDKSQPNILKLIFKCKPLMIVVLMGIFSSTRYLLNAGAIHAARYAFYIGPTLEGLSEIEREKAIQSSITTVNLMFSICTAIGMFGTMLLLPKLYKKFNYKQILLVTNAIGIIACIVMYFIGYNNFWACIPCLIFASIPLGAINTTSYAMIGDSLDYLELKTGRRENGLVNALQSFVNKLGNALATSFIVLMYIIVSLPVDMISSSNVSVSPTEMEPSVRQGIFMLVSIIPAVGMLLSSVPVFFYDIVGKKKEELHNELSLKREKLGIKIGE